MTEVLVTRGGQITLTKDVREKMHIVVGDIVVINVLGDAAVVTKKDPKAFEKSDFLPESFSKTLKEIRSFSWEGRLKRLGIVS
ncbi:MAG TPA: AbrB/MazE/SpoVT family DNA-binding domain-containing protein [Candidatus Nanoarchaeia archaeon]|nr:AbrB/MazE/SpoVT family DNA-binding domain-containing protein [Candidatus Nanoarchaeia archaeon]